MNPPAKVSIALATYNGERHLAEQLASLIAQERLPDELVVSDDASIDGTLAVAREFARTAPFPVVLTANAHAKGYRGNFQTAVEATTGDLVLLCDQDDVWLPHHVRRLVEALEAHDDVLAVASDSAAVDGELKPLGYTVFESERFAPAHREGIMRRGRDQFDLVLRYRAVAGHGMGFRRALAPIILPFPPDWIHDQWLFLLAAAFGKVDYVPEPLTHYRQHDTQSVSAAKKSLGAWAKDMQGQQATAGDADLVKWTELWERAEARRDGRPESDRAIRLLKEKVDFMRFRGTIRAAGGLQRAVGTTAQLLRGRYHRLGRGLLAYGRDLRGYR